MVDHLHKKAARSRRSCAPPERAAHAQPVADVYPVQYNHARKPISFLGNSLECLREFPEDARQDAGYALDQLERGKQPSDFKPMATIGKGVEELRVWDDTGTYRVI